MKTVTSSPHFHSGFSTQRIMIDVCIALLPACAFGVISFGLRALLVLAISIIAAVLTEFLLGKISKENTISDFSAVVTGMLVGMNMPANIPLFIPVIASCFAIAVVKWTFGGLGSNWANPAISGRIFVFFSFTSAMSTFPTPRAFTSCVDSVTSATPLSLIKTAVAANQFTGVSSFDIMAGNMYPVSEFAQKMSSLTGFNAYNIDAFVGNIPGCIGEVSTMCILIGAIYLLIRKVITLHIPLSYILSFGLLSWVFGGIPNGNGLFNGEVIPALLRGGLMLGVFFMATDMVTTPITHKGQIIFGIGCGFFTFLFRYFGSLPEGTSIAILIMNIVSPTIDKFCIPRRFGDTGKKTKEATK